MEEEEGIFRISASGANVTKILQAITKDFSFNTKTCEFLNPHDVAGAFKQYFRKSKIPAFPFDTYEKMISSYNDGHVSLEIIKSVVFDMDPVTRHVLGMTFSYLYNVQLHAETNLMGADNLGIVFGPTLLRDPCDVVDVGRLCFCSPIISTMTMHYKEIFKVFKFSFSSSSSYIFIYLFFIRKVKPK